MYIDFHVVNMEPTTNRELFNNNYNSMNVVGSLNNIMEEDISAERPLMDGNIYNPYIMHPGLSNIWEHTVPMRMPWSHSSQPLRLSDVNTVFPESFSSPYTAYTKTSDIPSCSKRFGRPKRRASSEQNSSSDAPPRKEFISEEKMAERMSALRLNSGALLFGESNNFDGYEKNIRSQQTLDEMDNRLIMSDEEDIEEDKKTVIELSPLIKHWTKIKSDILPKRIIEDLYRPCLDVVLWKPHGIITQAITERINDSSQSNPLPNMESDEPEHKSISKKDYGDDDEMEL